MTPWRRCLSSLAWATALAVATGAALAAGMILAGPEPVAGQSIAGTPHDFSRASWNPTGQICAVCHTPHNANTAVAGPLWSRQGSSVSEYTVYSSATLNADVGQPDGVSKTCLGCHDGTVALENFGGTEDGTTFTEGTARVGTDLSGDHPVSFTYDGALAAADGRLYDPGVQASGLGGTIAEDMLFNGKVQCASCHDPHDNRHGWFLAKPRSQSQLCTTCHAI